MQEEGGNHGGVMTDVHGAEDGPRHGHPKVELIHGGNILGYNRYLNRSTISREKPMKAKREAGEGKNYLTTSPREMPRSESADARRRHR